MAAMQKILPILVILLTISWGTNSAEDGYADRNRDYRPVGIMFAPDFKPKLVVMMNASIASQPMIFPPRAARKLGIRTSLKPGERAVMTMLVLLVLSGDVEANPGPIRHPCTICSKCVRKNQRAILCSKCGMWTHAKCCGVSIPEYQKLSDREDDSWLCPGCLMAELPFLEADRSTCDESCCSDDGDSEVFTDSQSTKSIPTGFSVFHSNTRSIYNSLCDLKDFTSDYKPSILALSETWLDTSVVDAELTIKGYSLYRKDRNRHGGGVAVYLKSSLTTQPIGDLIKPTPESSLESLWIAVSSPTLPSSIALCVCYRPPSSAPATVDDLFVEIDQAMSHYKRVIICGDVNVNLLCDGNLSQKFKCHIQMLGLHQIISTPTRITPTSVSLLDVMIVDNPASVVDSGTLDVALSDHLVCYSIFSWKSCVSKCPPPNYRRSLKTIDSTAFLNDLQCAPWSVMDMFDDPSDKNEVFNSLYKDILDQHAPLKKSQPRKHRAPWVDHELRKMMVRRNRLHRRFLKTRFPIDFEIYRSFRNRVTLLQKTAKRSYLHNLVQKKAHPSAIWSAVKLAMYNGSTPHSLTTSSDTIPTANELNVQFASIASAQSSISSSITTYSYEPSRSSHRCFILASYFPVNLF